MIKLLLLLSTITSSNSSARDGFKLYCRDKCKDTIGLSIAYYFTAINDTVKFRVDSQTGICYLPSKGTYKLYSMDNDYPLTYQFNGQTKDTINYPKLYFGISTATDVGYSNYINCSQIADGFIIDWFKEHKKRCEGKFKKGRLIGSLVYYDLNGQIVKIEKDPRRKRKPNR